jgi:opacity protein-like surface antigen
MQWKSIVVPILALLFVSVTVPARSQVAHSASEGKLPLTVGVGVSDYFLDWGHSRKMIGITAWADWRLQHMPSFLNGIGIEVEGHHIAYNRPTELIQMQQDSGLGGVNYQWRHYQRVKPYAKALAGFGSIDFPPFPNGYSHDTRTILAMGGGADIRVWNKVSVRADYEYQFWRHIFGPNDLNPNGFTVGAVYDFGRREY